MKWIIFKSRGHDNPTRPWQLWYANGMDRRFIARSTDHASCVKVIDRLTREWRRQARIDW